MTDSEMQPSNPTPPPPHRGAQQTTPVLGSPRRQTGFEHFVRGNNELTAKLFPIISRILGAWFLVFGLLASGLAVLGWANSQPFDDGVIVEGLVVDHSETLVTVDRDTPREREEVRFSSIIGYEVDGTAFEVERSNSSSQREALGTVYEISYRDSDPSDARIVGDGDLGLYIGVPLSVLFVIIGLGMFFGGPRISPHIVGINTKVQDSFFGPT